MIKEDRGDQKKGQVNLLRAQSKQSALGENNLQEGIPKSQKDGEFQRGKSHRKNIKRSRKGQTEGNQNPALIPKSKDQAEAKNENHRQSIPIQKFGGQKGSN
jgi:hypothetical protein